MKIDKKGFTLIELLAVVVILLAISVIAISSISAAIERNKAKQLDTKITLIERNVASYYELHKNTFTATCITIEELKNNGILDEDEATDADGNPIPGVVVRTGSVFEYNEVCP